MLTQLQNPIPLKTPKGKAWAVAVIDYGPQWDLQWVTFIHETGECWTFRNSQIRQEQNYTWGLPEPTQIKEPVEPQANPKEFQEAEEFSVIFPNMSGKYNGFERH